jgi:hypothetical protein
MYFLFVITTALAIQRYGKKVIFIFSFIIITALTLEIRPINEGGFEYFDFLFYFLKYPIVLPLAWCVLFFWVHNFSEGLIEIDDKFLPVIGGGIATGIIIGSMSLFFEPAGVVSGWWKYNGTGVSGITFFSVHAEVFVVYFLWGVFMGFIFRIGIYFNLLKTDDYHPPVLAYYPSISSIVVVSLLCMNTLSTEPILIFFYFGNFLLFPLIFIIKQRNVKL